VTNCKTSLSSSKTSLSQAISQQKTPQAKVEAENKVPKKQ